MTTGEKLVNALTPVVPTVKHAFYDGPEREYIVYKVDSQATFFGDDEVCAVETLAAVHWILPKDVSSKAKKLRIIRAICASELSCVGIDDESDEVTQHFVFWVKDIGGAG